jgi:hypothetical protein
VARGSGAAAGGAAEQGLASRSAAVCGGSMGAVVLQAEQGRDSVVGGAGPSAAVELQEAS